MATNDACCDGSGAFSHSSLLTCLPEGRTGADPCRTLPTRTARCRSASGTGPPAAALAGRPAPEPCAAGQRSCAADRPCCLRPRSGRLRACGSRAAAANRPRWPRSPCAPPSRSARHVWRRGTAGARTKARALACCCIDPHLRRVRAAVLQWLHPTPSPFPPPYRPVFSTCAPVCIMGSWGSIRAMVR